MDIFRVAFIGHREIDRTVEISNKLTEIIGALLEKKEFVEFYVGRNGEFDILVASVIKRLQREYDLKNSALILVLPYGVKDLEYYEKYYDEVYCPVGIDTHYKKAIKERNCWLVDNCDLLVACVERGEGGAYQTFKYAQKKGKEMIMV